MEFNKIFTTKLDNPALAQEILCLRRDYENDIDNVADYYCSGIIGYDRMLERTNEVIDHYNDKFVQIWISLDYEEQLRLLTKWGEFLKWAEIGILPVTPEMMTAVRIMK